MYVTGSDAWNSQKSDVGGQESGAKARTKCGRVYPSRRGAATEPITPNPWEMGPSGPIGRSSGTECRSGQPAGANRRQWLGRGGSGQENAGAAVQADDLALEVLASLVDGAVESRR